MAKEEKKAPKLRFNGYTNDWERKKLGEIGSVSMNKRIFKDETSTIGEIPFYKIGTFGGKADAFITREKYEEYKKKYPYPQKGNLLISASGSIGRIIEYNGEEAYYQDSNIVWLDHDNTILDVFLKPTYEIIKWDGIEGTTIKRLYNKNILNTVIYKPTIDEQRKIGKLFIILNNTIQLHERKCEELNLIKKALLQKLFPKKDEVTPEIRYKNFSAAWEQRKLGGVAKFYSGGTPSVGVSDYYDGTIPFIRSAEINSTSTELYLSELGLQNSSAKMVHRRDILYALYGATSGEVGISKINGAINQAILAIIPHKGYNSEFLEQWLKKNKEAIIKTYLQGGQGNLSGAIVKQIKVSFPSFDEQQKIGKSFQKIDSLITLHQGKLEKLKQLKKFLLQNMFI
ncbi:restriction endonuclease subunit S [Ligilactobacillus salivarius]|uniref:restriction endonuclease subunit S n=1 Tax=Ligilactobacillus salivarius TaxID=1624 RepID=UPI0013712B5E|nr:restriction endonuclease subunit S [Ligilactobacillus salivarius]MYY76501.1 restriction endonuclease subunit S [Ligilactobacillus salivarius]MYZ62227.1 restriction endonuclease subunit S [Ligilactobacillus salivarius]